MVQPLRLLIVEDVEDDALLLVRELRKGGFDPGHARVESAEELKTALENGSWDAVVADYSLPSFNGLDALRIVRERHPELPFILVSGVIGEEAAVEALHAGAHDYLMKGRYARLVPALERALRDAALRRERREAMEELARHRERLEELVLQRTGQLSAANEELKTALAEKDVLLRELAHRTKNNMQVIASLIDLQSVSSADPALAGKFADTRDRIRAMALVHEKLYRSPDLSSVNMKEYLTDVAKALLNSHAAANRNVSLSLDLEERTFPIGAALYCGLIINELVSNSLKYAFPRNRPGAVFLSLRRVGEGTELTYTDDGPGLPLDLDLAGIRTLGLKIVHNLAVRQLRGNMEIRNDPAAKFVFRLGAIAHMEKL